MSETEPVKEDIKIRVSDSDEQQKSSQGLCPLCKLPIRALRKGSFTSWIFSSSSCNCYRHAGSAIESESKRSKQKVERSATFPKLEDYEIQEVIGEGGMGTIFKAKNNAIDGALAIKVLKREFANDMASVKRFESEAMAASRLSHPNMVNIHGCGCTADGAPFIVMDYLEGANLSDTLQMQGPLAPDAALRIFIEIGEALEHAHAKGIVHRDLKPSNVFLAGDPNQAHVKLLDFGIAKVFESVGRSSLELTQSGDLFGSPLYMSPEQCLGDAVDSRSDIYSFGCLMFEVLTGAPPFTGENPMRVLMKHVHEEPPRPKQTVDGRPLSPDMMTIMSRCLQKLPDQRYPDTSELLIDLRRVAAGKKPRMHISLSSLGGGTKTGRKTSSKRQLTTMFALLCICLPLVIIGMIFYPTVQSVLFAKPWQKLAMQAAGESSRGPTNFSQARALLNKAILLAQQSNAPDMEKEDLYRQKAQLCSASADYQNAIKYFSMALALNANHKEDFNRGSMHDWLSSAYAETKDFKNAIEHGKLAVEIKRRTVGPNHPYTLFA
ncbi:MAG: protein kinase, partial [Cyanobacteria bacterium]|nr:protein kinase [Cyanobacteriota bacterium]